MNANLVRQAIGGVVLAGLLAAPVITQAQPTAHYAPGTEGIKAATLPPPGIWFRDYNQIYFSERLNDPQGHEVTGLNPKAFIYAQVPRVLWITDVKPLGGYLGVDALIPLKYTWLRAGGPEDHTFGVGDLFFEGTWSWHFKQWDAAFGAGVWAPTGASSPNPISTLAGNGYWTEMLTFGATWYPDKAKRCAVSVLNRYEFNQEKKDTDITPGQAYTVEGGVSYGILKGVDLGFIGYYQQQVTEDSGTGTTDNRDRVAGIGPELNVFLPDIMLGVSLRYAYEVIAKDRLQGSTMTLTVTKKF